MVVVEATVINVGGEAEVKGDKGGRGVDRGVKVITSSCSGDDGSWTNGGRGDETRNQLQTFYCSMPSMSLPSFLLAQEMHAVKWEAGEITMTTTPRIALGANVLIHRGQYDLNYLSCFRLFSANSVHCRGNMMAFP